MGKAIIFLRVSTLSQKLESQELIARRLAHADGYTDDDILEPIEYKESAVKLAEKDRQGLQDLYAVLDERNDIDAIYVTELSRLSRQPGVLYKIRDHLFEKKIQLVCGSPAFRLLDENKKMDKMAALIFAIFGCFAEQEAIEKKERFARGKEQKAIEGKFAGGNIPFGYCVDKDRDNLIVVDPVDSALVREVFNLYESGISQPKLAKHYAQRGVSKLTISFINNILNNERYTGRKHVYEGSSYERSYPVIITPEQFKRCREIANENNTVGDKARNVYYAHHLIVCKNCGCYFSASGSKVDYHCYNAFNVMRKYDHYKTPQCKLRLNVSINVMDSLLWMLAQDAELNYIIHAASEDKKMYQDKIADLSVKLSAVDVRLDEVAERRKRVVKSYIKGNIDEDEQNEMLLELDKERSTILLEQVGFQNELEHIIALLDGLDDLYGLDNVEGVAGHIEKIMQLKESIASITDDEQRSEIVHRHVQKVTVENRTIEYEFGIGKKKVQARYVTVWFFRGEVKYFYFIQNAGWGHTLILSADSEGNAIEKLNYEYLGRYYDEGKRKRHAKEREQRIAESEEAYPADKYVRGYDGLGSFLGFKGKHALHAGFRWVKNGTLEPACVGKYRSQNIFDKQKCVELMKAVAAKKSIQAWYARKVLTQMGIETDNSAN